MALYRNVSMSFWTDSKIMDDFSPEEKFFYLYLFTNPHTNLCGCYEISMRQATSETGYDTEKVLDLIEALERKHDVIRYNPTTKEVLILKWYKYNWTESAKFRKPLAVEIDGIKCIEFHNYLAEIFNGNDRVSIGYQYTMDTTVTVTVTDTVAVTDTVNKDSVSDEVKEAAEEIVGYLNQITGQKYKPTSKETLGYIKARLKDGFTVDDFKAVIYKKYHEWKDSPKMSAYIRPSTLFCAKHFESYLNQVQPRSPNDQFNDMLTEFVGGGEP